MFTSRPHNKELLLSTLISLAAALLFIARPLFAQTTTPPTSPNTPGVNEQNGNSNDFDDDVKQGKDELKRDPEAQKLQKEVVDGEDEQAGDGENHDIHEDSNLQEADHQERINEADQDNNNSEIDEVDDADNLDEQSQEVIDEHEQEKEDEMVTEAEKAVQEAEKEKQGLLDEAAKKNVVVSAEALNEFNNLLAQAKSALAAQNYQEALSLAKQAEESLNAVDESINGLEKIKEEENSRPEQNRSETSSTNSEPSQE